MKPKNKLFNPVASFIMFLVGIIYAGNQVLVNNIARALSASETQMASIISAMFIGSLIMVLALGELSERIGKRGGLCVALLFVTLGTTAVCLSRTIPAMTLSMLLLGFGTGGLESITLSLLEDNNGDKTNNVMGYVQSAFSVGGVIAPILASNLLPADRYKPGYMIAAVFAAALIIAILLYRGIDEFAVKTATEGGLAVFKVAKNRVVLLSALIMLLFIGCESGFTYWAVTYFRESGFEWAGAYAVSAYWFTSIAGRLISVKIKNLVDWYPWCLAASVACVVLMLVSPTAATKLISMGLLGFTLAPVYGGICFIGGHACPEFTAAAYSFILFGSALGGTLFQPLIGSIAEKWSLTTMFAVDAVILAAMAALMAVCIKLSRKARDNK